MIAGWSIKWIMACLSLHFLVSASVGLLVFLLTSTILSRITLFQDGVGVFSIYQFSLLVALCFAALAHIFADYFIGRF